MFIANNAGNASDGAIFPFPISTPIKVPITWAITAPGPSNGDKKGNEQMNPNITRPIPFPVRGIWFSQTSHLYQNLGLYLLVMKRIP